jgi:hypothetical protein
MSFQKSHLELTLADVLQIVRGWLSEGELHNAHIRIGQAFGPLVRGQVLFAIDVVQVALPAGGPAEQETIDGVVPEMTLSAADLPAGELSAYDKLEVVGVSDAVAGEQDDLRF